MYTQTTQRATAVLAFLLGLSMAFLGAQVALADHYEFPSTNDANRANGDPHVNQVATDIGSTTLEFVNPKSYIVCFEYRTDGDTSQATGNPNFNPEIHDLYPFTCLTDDTERMSFTADEYVEVRSVFGAERDHDFDWTRFDVGTKQDCFDGGWESYGFKNQGQCVRFAETGMDSR